ncbi:MAG: serine/threonine-protein kinase [Planctomycetota bacterium]|nr:serine/threonine-protein kinase [Planctomycetota bacterium]
MTEREIFESALDINNPGSRRSFLVRACGDNVALRSRLEALLAAHFGAGSFLAVPAVERLDPATPEATEETCVQNLGAPADTDSDHEIPNSTELSFLLPSPNPGSLGRLGHYDIQSVLGRGSFGIVFKAFDEKLERLVAIKVIDPQMAQTSPPRKRFLREARAAARVRHENVVQVYSVDDQPIPYLVMEYIEGPTLQQRLNENGPLEIPEILKIAVQTARGIAAAHALGLIHRDIKPGNILLENGSEPRVKITDFGLARTADDASLSQSGVVAGTPMYMSPEQATGDSLDLRSDLFSFGSVLYTAASGRPPFRAPNMVGVLRRVVEEQPRRLREVLSDIPEWLEAIVEKLHAKERTERYQSAREVAELFERCETEWKSTGTVTEVLPAYKPPQPVPSPTPSSPPATSNRKEWLVAAASAIALILGLISLYNQTRSRQASGEHQLPEPAAPVEPAPQVEPDPPAAQSSAWYNWPLDAPAPAIAPFTPQQAKAHQEA